MQNNKPDRLREVPRWPYFLGAAGISVVYFVAAKLGLNLAYVHESATAVWPPTGIAIASLLLLGMRYWPGVFIGALIANGTTDVGWPVAVGIATGNTLEAIAAVLLINKFGNSQRVFDRVWTIVRYVALFAPLATLISATIGVTSLVLGGPITWEHAGPIWFTWWLGDMVGAIVFAPLIVLWSQLPMPRVVLPRLIELIVVVVMSIVLSVVVFGAVASIDRGVSLSFLILPPLMWSAVRFGRRGAVTVACAIAAVAMWGTLRGHGPFHTDDPNESLLVLQSFVATITVTALIMAALTIQTRSAELALGLQESRLEIALSAAKVGLWDWHIESGAVSWAGALESVHGLPSGAFGGTFEDFQRDMHPHDCERVLHAVQNAVKTKSEYQVEYRIVRPDGKIRWLEARGKVILNESGNPARMTGICADITPRKLAEEALRQSEERHRALTEASSDAVWIWNPSAPAGSEDIVRSWKEMTGIDAGSSGPEEPSRAIAAHDRERVIAAWAQALQAGAQFEQEFDVIGGEGGVHRLKVHAVPIENADGSVREWCGSLADVTARHQAEQLLQRERELLQTIIDRIPVMITLYEPSTQTLRLNHEFQRVVGWSSEDARGRSLMEQCYPDPALRQQVHNLMQTGDGRWIDLPMRTRDDRVIETSWANIRLSDGMQVGIGIDISTRKELEHELTELAEDRRNHFEELRTLVDVMPAGVFIAHDPECRVITANRAGAAMLGLPDENFNASKTGMAADRLPFRVLKDGREIPSDELPMQRCARLGISIQGEECDIVRDDGNVAHVYEFVAPLRSGDGRVRGCIGVFIDITELKRADRAIRATESLASQRLHELLSIYETVPIGICFLDTTLRFVKANQRLAEINGCTIDELVGRCLEEFTPPDSDVPDLLRRVIASGEPILDREQIEVTPSDQGVPRVWLQSFYPVKDSRGKVLGVNCVVLDITERKKVELELRKHREQLEDLVISRTADLEHSHQQLRSAERILAMGTLAAGLGHDIGNLLLPIKSRLDALDSLALPEETKPHFRAISSCLNHLQRMVRGLRLFSQDPQRRHEGSAATTLSEWHSEVEPFFRSVMRSHMRLEFDIPDDLPTIDIAPHALSQAVLNLITNSRDAIGSKRGGRILIRARSASAGEMVRIEIRDNGQGMTPMVRARAIEPFFTTRTRSLSTGLGLSVVHGVVRAARGNLEIHSPPPADIEHWNTGTAVILNLPVNRRQERLDDDRASTVTVSIADQRTDSLLKTMLGGMGFTVLPSNNGVSEESGVWITEHGEGRLEAARAFLNGHTDRTVILVGEAPPEWSELAIKVIDRSCIPSALKAALA